MSTISFRIHRFSFFLTKDDLFPRINQNEYQIFENWQNDNKEHWLFRWNSLGVCACYHILIKTFMIDVWFSEKVSIIGHYCCIVVLVSWILFNSFIWRIVATGQFDRLMKSFFLSFKPNQINRFVRKKQNEWQLSRNLLITLIWSAKKKVLAKNTVLEIKNKKIKWQVFQTKNTNRKIDRPNQQAWMLISTKKMAIYQTWKLFSFFFCLLRQKQKRQQQLPQIKMAKDNN